jgi:hypothetical protein
MLTVPAATSSCSDDSFCDDMCDAVMACDPSATAQHCNTWCGELRGAIERDYREDFAPLLVECATEATCTQLLDGDYFDTCWERGKAELPPTSQTFAYCHAVVPAGFECGSWWTVDECLASGVRLWSDDVLIDAQSCLSLDDCGQMDGCLEKAFGAP